MQNLQTYPRSWSYILITQDENATKIAVKNIMQKSFNLRLKNKSKNEKFVSLELSLEVQSLDEQHEIYNKLLKIPSILQVL